MLAAAGGLVVIADMQQDRGEAVARDIGGAFVKCDVASEADGQAVVAKAVSMGKLMGLVNCAGIAPAEKTVGKNGAHGLASFSKTITVNLIGSFNMIRLAAEAMSKNEPDAGGERGVIVSTAYMDEAERCTQVFVMHKGLLLAEGAPGALRERARDGLVQIAAKTVTRTIGSSLGRQIVRGILGSLLGGRR